MLSAPATRHPPPATHVKLTDFGLARMVDDVGLTQNGVVAGTPEYMAPEQARGDPVDHRAGLDDPAVGAFTRAMRLVSCALIAACHMHLPAEEPKPLAPPTLMWLATVTFNSVSVPFLMSRPGWTWVESLPKLPLTCSRLLPLPTLRLTLPPLISNRLSPVLAWLA